SPNFRDVTRSYRPSQNPLCRCRRGEDRPDFAQARGTRDRREDEDSVAAATPATQATPPTSARATTKAPGHSRRRPTARSAVPGVHIRRRRIVTARYSGALCATASPFLASTFFFSPSL